MGKKKGKDKNKLARMSEEERIRYLQHRAELEEEAKRRKQQLISTFMKVWNFFVLDVLRSLRNFWVFYMIEPCHIWLIYASAQSFSRFLFNKKSDARSTIFRRYCADFMYFFLFLSHFILLLHFFCHIYKFYSSCIAE